MNEQHIMDKYCEFLLDENRQLKARIAELESKNTNLKCSYIMARLKNNKFAAEEIRKAARHLEKTVNSYMGDAEIVHIDELLDYADALERGEL